MKSKTLGKRIAEARTMGLGRRVTQAELARHLDVTPQAVSGWERDESMPEADKLTKIALYLRVSIAWLLEGDSAGELVPQRNDRGTVFVHLVDNLPAHKVAGKTSEIGTDALPAVLATNLPRGEFVALTVQDDAMDRISPEGSVIIVNKTDRTLEVGKPFLFHYRGKIVLRIWRNDPPRLQPHSTNPTHEPIYLKNKREADSMVVGRVVRSTIDL
ncbi:XRE family transcriptional regulator [Bradyrhizobium oligotrophicum]|uniref:XRE family transcriptional regulator n=1 Tax=Bradyrhizobium oligotrophicum TaxID=44255 RepID=UPI003EBDA5EE